MLGNGKGAAVYGGIFGSDQYFIRDSLSMVVGSKERGFGLGYGVGELVVIWGFR